jgi:1-phosphofructokinase
VIVTVTPNPSLDLTYQLGGDSVLEQAFDRAFEPTSGRAPDRAVEVYRARSVTIEASGKGVNVSRALTLAGRQSLAVLFAGGPTGQQLLELLDADRVSHQAVPQAGPTRVNTTVLSPGGATTKVNAPGSALSTAEIDNLVIAVDNVLVTLSAQSGGISGVQTENWLLICGSLSPETDAAKLIGRLIETARAHGWRCAVDSSEAALAAGFDAGADLLAPNAAELEAVRPGPPAVGLNAVLETATALAAQRGCELLVSLGADGALWTDGRLTLHARGPAVVPVNTAGAGDALLAGWFSTPTELAEPVEGPLEGPVAGTDRADLGHRLATAVAWGAAACLAPTTVATEPPPNLPGWLDSVQVSEWIPDEPENDYPQAAPP